MRILSADAMANIPKEAIKKLIKKYTKAKITDDAVAELAAMLEEKAKEISLFAVKNAKKEDRKVITKKDVSRYMIESGD